MKLYERFADRGYHTSIATTFGVDFDAYENIVLPRLRGSGCHNNILLADGGMLPLALETPDALPRHAGRLYTVSGITVGGAFHPKLFLQLGRKGGRMIVSSANITPSGLGGNLELAGELNCDEEGSGEQRLIALAARYALRLAAGRGEAVANQLSWMDARTPWLRKVAPADGAVSLKDGTQAALLATGNGTGLGPQFAALVDDAPVKRLIVLSPYWDDELDALGDLAQRLSCGSIAVLIDQTTECFPASALSKLSGVRVYDRGSFREGRFIHAKLIIAQTSAFDHVLYGSSNCTLAALGKQNFAGRNEEVCIYRRVPAGAAMAVLELEELIAKSEPLDPATLKVGVTTDDIDLSQQASRTPGRFECQYDVLIWTPPAGIDADTVSIELLDGDGLLIPCKLSAQATNTSVRRRYFIGDAEKRPSFARLRHPGGILSAPAVVALLDALRDVAREARTRHVEDAATRLAENTEEGLWLLEALNTLEAAELGQQIPEAPRSVIDKCAKDEEEAAGTFRKLNYEEFIAGRRAREAHSAVSRNSLSGSELSIVRGYLNRVLGFGEEPGKDDDPALPGKGFDLGDETADPEATIKNDVLSTAKKDVDEAEEEKKRLEEQKRRAQRKASKKEMIDSVESFIKKLADRKTEEALNTFDVLRLRVMLMIVAAAGWNGRETKGVAQVSLTSLQVLPVEGDANNSWPYVLGRVLFGFFGGSDPVIRHVQIEAVHDQLSADMLECWATCFWTVQATLNAPASKTEHERFAARFYSTAERVYRLTGLTSAELLADDVRTLMDRLTERFGKRLGVESGAIERGHLAMVQAVFPAG